MASSAPDPNADLLRLTRTHLRFGWYAVLVFLVLGAALEIFHGLKVQWYLAVANETRRLMWTLAHAHGTLLGLLNIAFALTVRVVPPESARPLRLGSRALLGATVLLPLGFLLGGIVLYAGDPGPGVLLVPLGALLLFVATAIAGAMSGRIGRE
ncbi:MAG: hypothetical protein ACYTGP_11160 [Planctomycetota bacterium]|jgi:hypothetical protein